MSFKWCMVVVFLHIASELEMLVAVFFPLELCHCYLNTIVCSHKSFPFSVTSCFEIARHIKDHRNYCISVVASNYSQCPELCALIHHLMSCLNPQPNLFCYQTQLSGLKCAAFGSMLCRLSSLSPSDLV